MIPRSAQPVPRHVRHETHVHPVNADFYHVHSMNVNRDSCHEKGHEDSTELRNPLCLDTDARGGGSLSMNMVLIYAV